MVDVHVGLAHVPDELRNHRTGRCSHAGGAQLPHFRLVRHVEACGNDGHEARPTGEEEGNPWRWAGTAG